MTWMGSMPRSTRALEIPTTSYGSRLALVMHLLLILSTCTWVMSSSADRYRPSGGCMLLSSSSTNITSHTSKSVSYRKRRIWSSSNIRLRSMSYLDMELETRAWVKKSCWTALGRTRPASCSMSTFPRARSKAANPSSHAMMAPSLLSSSLSWARSCPCSSTTTTCEGDGALH
jgi:hypothetical protein